MKLIVSPRAFRDTEEIRDYLHARNPHAASRVAEEIEKTIDRIVDFPEAGQDQTDEGVKRAVVRRYGYLVYYRYSKDNEWLEIVTIRRGKQRPVFEKT